MAPSAIRARARGRSPRAALGRWLAGARTVASPVRRRCSPSPRSRSWPGHSCFLRSRGPTRRRTSRTSSTLRRQASAPERTGGNGRNVSTEQAEAMSWADLLALAGFSARAPGGRRRRSERWREVEASLPDEASADGTGPNAVGQNPPLYYALEADPLSPRAGRFVLQPLLRDAAWQRGFYLATVAFMWLIASELFRPLWARTLATALVALQPKLAMLGAVINADILLVLAWTAFIYAGLRIIRHGPSVEAAGRCRSGSRGLRPHARPRARDPRALVVLLGIAYLRWRPRPARRSGVRALSLGIAAARPRGRRDCSPPECPAAAPIYGGEIGRIGRAGLQRPRVPFLRLAVLPARSWGSCNRASALRATGSGRSTSSPSTATSPRSRSSIPRFATRPPAGRRRCCCCSASTPSRVTRFDAVKRHWPTHRVPAPHRPVAARAASRDVLQQHAGQPGRPAVHRPLPASRWSRSWQSP